MVLGASVSIGFSTEWAECLLVTDSDSACDPRKHEVLTYEELFSIQQVCHLEIQTQIVSSSLFCYLTLHKIYFRGLYTYGGWDGGWGGEGRGTSIPYPLK